jgi:uncharacterized protein
MKIDRWIRKFLPRSDKFLALFVKDVENLSRAPQMLRELMSATTEQDRLRIVRAIEDLEHRGDEITHTIFHELSLTFITILDREDIGAMASALDNILDNIDQASTAIHLYQMTSFDDPFRDLVDVLDKQVIELGRAIPELRDLHDVDRIRESCVKVNAYENQADLIFHRALGRLFQDEKDPIELIKKKEILSMLEWATDRCEDVAVLIENVLLKHG